MKKHLPLLLTAFLCIDMSCFAQTTPPAQTVTLRSILLEQLQTTHDKQDWFVPAVKALDGLTPAQAMWRPSDSSHSIGQLVNHLIFWNKEELDKFYGRKTAPFNGDNNQTFVFDEKSWASAISQLDEILKSWETAVRESDDAKLQTWYSIIAHIGTHNAYHTGQILYIRKLQGSWNPEKGVK